MNLEAYPHPLAVAWDAVEQESTPFIRLHRVFDAFETLIRYCATITLCSLNSGELPSKTKKDLVEKMERPSLGIWVDLLRMTVEIDSKHSVPELGGKQGFFQKHIAPCTGGGKDDLVSQRNQVAHGGFLTNEQSQIILRKVEPKVRGLYEAAAFLEEYPLVAVNEGRQASFIGLHPAQSWHPSSLADGFYLFPKETDVSRPPASFLSLFPLQAYRPIFKWTGDDPEPAEPSACLFYARLKPRHLEYQSYQGQVSQDPEARRHFVQAFPLDQWRRELAMADKYAFVEHRQQLLSGFSGREEQVERLRRWAEGEQSHLFLYGKPGIGKSALVTYALRDFQERPLKGKKDRQFFLYYFRAYDGRCSTPIFLEAAVLKIRELYGLSCSLPQEISDQIQNFHQLLREVSEKLQPNRGELIFVLDGLDEAITQGHREIVSFIPFPQSPETPGVRWLLSGRENCTNPYFDIKKHMEDRSVPKLELGRMSDGEIISLLSECGAKYAFLQNPDRERMIELAVARSEGNPLYLQGLLEDLVSGRKKLELSSFEELPKGIEGFFDENMQRIGVVGLAQERKAILLSLAWAKRALPLETIIQLGRGFKAEDDSQEEWETELSKAINGTIQFLTEGYLEDGTAVYSLYHEGLREYFHTKEVLVKDMQRALRSINKVLFDWLPLQGFIRSYALSYTAHHLYELRDIDRMWQLLKDEAFRKTQINELSRYHEAIDSLRHGIMLYSEENEKQMSPEYVGRLAWLVLKYGETGEQSRTDVSSAWQWACEGRMEDALKRLEFVDEEYFFKAAIYLLWIEADRMKEVLGEHEEFSVLPKEMTRPFTRNARLVLQAVENTIPHGGGTVDWGQFATPDFMSFWCNTVLIIPRMDVLPIVRHAKGQGRLTVTKYLAIRHHYEQALKVANAIEDFRDRDIAMEDISQILAGGRRYKQAWEVAYRIERFKLNALMQIAITALAKQDYEDARQITENIDSPSFKAITLIEIAKATGQERDFEQAIYTALMITIEPDRSAALVGIAKLLAEKRDCERARQIAWSIVNKQQKLDALLEIAKVTGDQQHYEQAIQFAKSIKGGPEKSGLLLKISKILAENGDCERAWHVAWSIEDRPQRFDALLEIVRIRGDRRYCEAAIQLARRIKSRADRANVLIEIAKVLARKGDCERARQIAWSIADKRQKLDALLEIAKVTGDQQHCEQAIQFAKSIKGGPEKSSLLLKASKILAENGDCERAWHVASSIEDNRQKFDALLEIVRVTGDHQHYSQAIQLAKSIRVGWGKYNPLVEIARTLAEQQCYERAIQVAKSIRGAWDKSRVLQEISKGLSEQLQYERAIQVANSIKNGPDKSDALVGIVKILVEKGDYDRAIEVTGIIEYAANRGESLLAITQALVGDGQYDRALDIALRIEHKGPRCLALLEIAKTRGEKQLFQEVLRVVPDTVALRRYKTFALIDIIKDLANENYFKEAIQITSEIDDTSLKSMMLMKIAKALAENQQPGRAAELANTVEEEWIKCMSFLEVAKATEETSHYERALAVAQNTKNSLNKCICLVQIADATGDVKYCEHALNISSEIEDGWEKCEALFGVAVVFAKNRRRDKALKAANCIEHEEIKFDALSRIAAALAENHELDSAMKIAQRIKHIEPKSRAFLEIALVLVNNSDYEQALKAILLIEDAPIKCEALVAVAEATGITRLYEEALKSAINIESEREKASSFLLIAKAVGYYELYEDVLQMISHSLNQSDKSLILNEFTGSIRTPEVFGMLARWHQREQESLSSETTERFCLKLVEQIHQTLESLKDLEVLLQWTPILPPSLKIAYAWFSALDCVFIRSQQTKYVDSIHRRCPQMGLEITLSDNSGIRSLPKKLENPQARVEDPEVQSKLKARLDSIREGKWTIDDFWVKRPNVKKLRFIKRPKKKFDPVRFQLDHYPCPERYWLTDERCPYCSRALCLTPLENGLWCEGCVRLVVQFPGWNDCPICGYAVQDREVCPVCEGDKGSWNDNINP